MAESFNKNLPEESFAELDLEEDGAKIEEARKLAKESPLDRRLSRLIIDYVYNNITNVLNGQKLDHSLADINPECEEIIEALGDFEREEGFAPENKDIFSYLKSYDQARGKIKTKQELSPKKLELIGAKLKKQGFGQDYDQLGTALSLLSERINKDVVKDLIARNNLEKKASALTDKIVSQSHEAMDYANITSEINYLIDTYGASLKMELAPKDQALPDKIKKQLLKIIDLEIGRSRDQEFEFAKMDEKARENFIKRLLKIKDDISSDPKKIFDVNNYGFIGLMLEKRQSGFMQIQDQYEKINERLVKYLP